MHNERLLLWEKDEYHYNDNFSFIPFITPKLHEDTQNHPAVIVVPGGGYAHVSPIEAEVIMTKFYEAGFNTFLLSYTVNPYGLYKPVMYQSLRDISKAVIEVRKNAETFHIIADNVAVCGFSAGGHLCGSLAVHWNKDFLKDINGIEAFSNRPDAVILSYPVITSGEFAHRGSFHNLLGSDASPEALEYMSLEKQIGSHTPPVFLWHTTVDDVVPVENSLFFGQALKDKKIPFEMHIFQDGHHGLSTANSKDDHLVDRWKSPVLEQNEEFLKAEIERRKIEDPESSLGGIPIADISGFEEFKAISVRNSHKISDYPQAAQWVTLTVNWLRNIFKS